MNIINKLLCKITPTQEYNYFDQYSQLQAKKLHIFQRIARQAFKWYAETHLKNVVSRGYEVTLNDQFQATPAKEQQLLSLISKANSVYNYYKPLPDRQLADGSGVKISIRYTISANANNISSVDFNIQFSKKFFRPETLQPLNDQLITIYKNCNGAITARLPTAVFVPVDLSSYSSTGIAELRSNIFRLENDCSQESIDECARIINDLLAKTINDSSPDSVPEMCCYMPDNSYIHRSIGSSNFDPEAANIAQMRGMNNLGWKFSRQFLEKSFMAVTGAKRVYNFNRNVAANNQTLATTGFNQNLSLSFATKFLAPSEKEYLM